MSYITKIRLPDGTEIELQDANALHAEDFADLEPIEGKYTTAKLAEQHNALLRAMKRMAAGGAAAFALVFGAPAFGASAVEVQSARMDRIYNDARVVTNVTGLAELLDELGAVSRAVSAWETYWSGSNVVIEVTNYYACTDGSLPSMRIRELGTDGVERVVWSEIARHTNLLEAARIHADGATNALAEAVAGRFAAMDEAKAPRAWGRATSAGGVAPENVVWMSEPSVVFAGGMEFERIAVGAGVISVLTARGAPVYTQGDAGTFFFRTPDGAKYFGFGVQDAYSIGAKTDAITYAGGLLTLVYDVTMEGYPCLYHSSVWPVSYAAASWQQLNFSDGTAAPDAPYLVQWDDAPDPGTKRCFINVGEPTGVGGFISARIESVGDATFETNMRAKLTGGILAATNLQTGASTYVEPYVDADGQVKWRVRQ